MLLLKIAIDVCCDWIMGTVKSHEFVMWSSLTWYCIRDSYRDHSGRGLSQWETTVTSSLIGWARTQNDPWAMMNWIPNISSLQRIHRVSLSPCSTVYYYNMILHRSTVDISLPDRLEQMNLSRFWTHERHSILHPHGWDMECLLWVFCLEMMIRR